MTEKEKVKAATEVARNLKLETIEAKEALIEAAGGNPRPALLGENVNDPAPGVFDLYWAGQLLSRLSTPPNLTASRSPLKEARDRGCEEAGEVFEILGDGAPLPALPVEVIEAAAVWAVIYIDQRIEAEGPQPPFSGGCYTKSRRPALIEDLFLRSIGARRIKERPGGFGEIQAAAFFRRLFDLGGQF